MSVRVKLIAHEKSLFFIHSYGDLILLSFGVIDLNAEAKAKLNSEVVQKAMALLQRRHPTLRAYLEQDVVSQDVHMVISDDFEDVEFMRARLGWSRVATREAMWQRLTESSADRFKFGQRSLMWKCEAVEFGNFKYRIVHSRTTESFARI
jgi:hypothetical protein